jgi:HD-GYP domain-containing protein (c-di-GMP phosphodiesterase class II)
MTRFLNLTGRTFFLISSAIGLGLAMARVMGALSATPLETVTGGLLFSIVMSLSVSQLRISALRALKEAVLNSKRTGKLTPDFPENSPMPEVNHLAAALNGAVRSIQSSQADLERAYLQFVETMAQALDARDPYTAGHSLRVAYYSHTLAIALGLSDQDAESIRIAAQLHDIGKIGIPDLILQKPGRLTPDEYGLIKLHPQIGRRILEKVARFEGLLSVVELHHENQDGSGYPYGLPGNKVPVAARIVHIADSFDAMTSTRSYRSALSLRSAVHEIERNSGTQFDPVIANVFLKLIAAGKIETGSLKVSEDISASRIPALT